MYVYVCTSVVRNVHASLIANGRRQRHRCCRFVACQANTHHIRANPRRGVKTEALKPGVEGYRSLFQSSRESCTHTVVRINDATLTARARESRLKDGALCEQQWEHTTHPPVSAFVLTTARLTSRRTHCALPRSTVARNSRILLSFVSASLFSFRTNLSSICSRGRNEDRSEFLAFSNWRSAFVPLLISNRENASALRKLLREDASFVKKKVSRSEFLAVSARRREINPKSEYQTNLLEKQANYEFIMRTKNCSLVIKIGILITSRVKRIH